MFCHCEKEYVTVFNTNMDRRERQIERDRERKEDRQTERERERETDRETERYRDR